MKIDHKIESLFESLNNNEIKQFLQLIVDRKPEESGLLGLFEFKKSLNKPVETTNEQLNRNNQADMKKACCLQGNNKCECFHFCTLSGEQIDSILS